MKREDIIREVIEERAGSKAGPVNSAMECQTVVTRINLFGNCQPITAFPAAFANGRCSRKPIQPRFLAWRSNLEPGNL